MEPRPYQAEAFDAARKSNVVMVGATGVGKTLVSLMLIRDFYFEDARRRDPETHKWCVFLCPTQELVFQQAKSAQIFTGVRCGPYVGKDLDYWGLKKWRHEMDTKEVLVMTPNALLNLLHRGKEYLTLMDVGVLVFDECHQARKKHPYARVMNFYKELQEKGDPLPKVFGMTASPTVECVEVLRCKAYVCEDNLIEDYQANADWELLCYLSFMPSPTVVEELEAIMRMLFADLMCGFADTKERFVDIVVAPVLFSYQHLGLWCAVRHAIIFCEAYLRSRKAQGMRHKPRIIRVKKVVTQLIQKLGESPLGLATGGVKQPPTELALATPATGEELQAMETTALGGEDGGVGPGSGALPKNASDCEGSNGLGDGNPANDVVEVGITGGARAPSPLTTRNSAGNVGVAAASAPAAAGNRFLLQAAGSGGVEEEKTNGVLDVEEGDNGLGGGVMAVDDDGKGDDGAREYRGAPEAVIAREAERDEGWGITPGRVKTLVKTLVAEVDEWGENANNLRCMVFVERRSTARVLCEYLSHCLNGRLNCGFVVGRSNSRGSSFRGRDSSRRRKEWKPVPDDVAPGENPKRQQEEDEGEEKEPQEKHEDVDSAAAVLGSVSANSNRNNGEEDHDGRGEEEEENAVDDACESLGARKAKVQGDGVEEDEDEIKKTRVAHTINLFRIGQVQVLVTTDACSEGIDVPECNLVISMDKIKNSRSLIHTRGRARSKGGKFIIMVEDRDQVERERISRMLLESEDIKRFQLGFEKASLRVPLRQAHPKMVHRIDSSGAVVDMDMSSSLLFEVLSALGCDFHPLLVVEGSSQSAASYKCRMELPSFLDVGTLDTDVAPEERFLTKSEARSAVCYLAVLKMLEKGYIDERLNPTRTKDRLVVESRRTFDPVVSVSSGSRESRAKATMPVPRPIAMGILRTPSVDFERARLAVWGKSTELLAPSDADWWRSQSAARKKNGLQEGGVVYENGEASGRGVERTVAASNGHVMSVDAEEPAGNSDKGKSGDEDAQTRGCYEGVPGPKRRMRVYCFRSPPGELDGWAPSSKEPRIRRAAARGSKRSSSSKKEGEDKDKEGGAEGDENNEALESKSAEEEDDGSDDETDLRTFHPKLRVDVGGGPGKGLGPRLYVGLASAAPLPLTATQADKVGIEDSFDVELNPAQMAAIVQWHRETLGMVALYDIPHQLTRTPELDPEKCPFRDAGELGDKGVVAVPVEFIETSGGGDTPAIDWTAIEAANAGTQPPSDTDQEYSRRILFSRVSHKTCRFYFVLERTSTTLGEYLQRCLESDLGPYAGLPCETITDHPAGTYGRVRGSLAVGHGVRKPDYDAAYKSQQLLLGVPAPALRHSFAQHLIRGEKVMDPDAGVRRRVMLSQRVDPEKPDATAVDEGERDAEEDAMEVDEEIAAGDGREEAAPKPSPVKGWAGVSTLKSNRHRVGTAQPVLLVEQYTQAVCMTREVFVSVLHIVPRMFDLERQLLCFVLHEAVFLPALQASLYHRSPARTAAETKGDVSPKIQAVTCPEAEIDTSPGTNTLASPGTEADASLNGQAPLVAVPAPAKTFAGAIDTSPDGDAAQRSGVEIDWPSNGVWNAPGRGAGTGSGPGGATSSDPGCVLAREGSAEVEAAARWAGAAAAEAAAMGVIQWQGGQEGAVVDTLALLDCSLRRPVNERLETLGDAWLNYYAGFVVFQDKPVMMEEGMMTLLRKNVVSNARLIKCADGRGLREFMYPPRSILGRPFEMWAPSLLPLPPAVKANRKTIADVVEALLGAALVAGGNRSAAFLMEWLGLPTLEASNNPDRPDEPPAQQQQEQHQQQQKMPQETEVAGEDSVVVENGSENPREGVTNILPLQGTTTEPPPTGAEACTSAAVGLKKAAAAAAAETSGSGFIGEVDGGEGAGGDNQLTVSCDPMDDGGGYDNGNNGCGNGNCNGNNASVGGGTGQEGNQEGGQENRKGGSVPSMGVLEEMEGKDMEEGEEETASTTKRKAAPLGLVEAPKRIRTSEGVGGASEEASALEKDTGEDEVDIGGTETPSSADTAASSALSVEGTQDASESGALGEKASELGTDADGVGPAAAAATDVIEDIINDVIANADSSEEHEKGQDEVEEVEDSGDEGNASDIARKLSADAKADGRGSRRRAPLPDHGPQVGEKERPWLWNPPAYMLHENPAGCSNSGDLDGPVDGGAPKESGGTRSDSCADCPADRVNISHNDETISTSSGQTGAGSGDVAGTAEPTEVAAMEVDEVIADGREADSPNDRTSSSAAAAALEQETANETSRSPEPQLGPSTEGVSTESDGVLEEAKEEAVQEKWKGLLLEGLKESAQWPIRRESLMSVGFLVDTGVLPKVYVTTKPSARLMGNITRLEQKLSYTFKHPWLCMQAITHPSWTMFDRAWKHAGLEGVIDGEGAGDDPRVNSRPGCLGTSVVGSKSPAEPGTVPAQDYQRLEFLGDAVLGWLVTAHLYFASSTFTPAELTRIKASCVCNASLWFIALKLDIHNVLRASPKILGNVHAFVENQNNNRTLPGKSTPPKHPADVLEALIGAVFLDSSCCMDTVSRVFWPLMAQHLQEHPPPPAEDEVDGVVTQRKPFIPRGGAAPMNTSAPDTSGGGAGASPACAGAPPARATAGPGDDVDVAGNVANGINASAMAAGDLVDAGILAMAADDIVDASVSAMAADDLADAGVSAMAAYDDHSPASDSLGVSASAGAAPSGDGHGASDSGTEADICLAKEAKDEFVGLGGGRDGYGEAGVFVYRSCSAAADLGEGGAGVTPMAVDGDTLEGHSER